MTDRNDMIAPLPLGGGSDSPGTGVPPVIAPLDGSQAEAIGSIVFDVEHFARGWIGRIRRLIHRSSQLIERESLLAGAISRLDQQKTEWSKRTAAKEEGLRDQSKRLTEAWLEVESERRKAIQGARAAATVANKSAIGPVVPSVPAGVSTGTMPTAAGLPQPTGAGPLPIAPAAEPPRDPNLPSPAAIQRQMPAAPPSVNVNVPVCGPNTAPPADGRGGSPVMPVGNAPILPGQPASGYQGASTQDRDQQAALEHAEAARQQKIEEFKRMQRAIRSNRSQSN
ncbi:hypothetical protein [Stieleria sp.]|uniref:hypothetical protein n=1 Tax=Stieleria sp. TaxID=2795976 RepID=UPI0035698F7B